MGFHPSILCGCKQRKGIIHTKPISFSKVSSFDAPIDDLDLNDSWNIKLSIMGMGESKNYYLKSNNDASTIEAQTNIFGTVTPFQIEDTFKESLNQWTTKLRETQIFNLNLMRFRPSN